MDAGPGLKRLAAFDEFLVGRRQLPDAVRPLSGSWDLIGHQVAVFRPRLEIVEIANRGAGIAEGWVDRDVARLAAVDENPAAVAQGLEMFGTCLDHVCAPLRAFAVMCVQS